MSVSVKFGVNVNYAKIKLFKKAVESMVKQRPREWLGLLGFRATRVEQDLGFIEYVVVLQVSQFNLDGSFAICIPTATHKVHPALTFQLEPCSTAKAGRTLRRFSTVRPRLRASLWRWKSSLVCDTLLRRSP